MRSRHAPAGAITFANLVALAALAACGRESPTATVVAAVTSAESSTCVVRRRCGADDMNCGGLCTDVVVDPHNCGLCGVNCARDRVCVGGLCVPPTPDFPGRAHAGPARTALCAAGAADCGEGCVALLRSNDHCGCCGVRCTGATRCVNGACR